VELPKLPKQYKRTEAKIDGLVLDWFFKNYNGDVAIEVKIKGNKVLPHQAIALDQVQKGKFKYKIPDMGRKNPFDGFVLKHAEGFVVTCDGLECEAVNPAKSFKFSLNKKHAA
jgi:hypothetical protein